MSFIFNEKVFKSTGSLYKERYERTLRELDFTKKSLHHEHEEDMEKELATRKHLEKRVGIELPTLKPVHWSSKRWSKMLLKEFWDEYGGENRNTSAGV